MPAPDDENMITKAAIAVVLSYLENRDNDAAAKKALQNAAPTWHPDHVEGFLKRQKDRLKPAANTLRSSIERAVSHEKKRGSGV